MINLDYVTVWVLETWQKVLPNAIEFDKRQCSSGHHGAEVVLKRVFCIDVDKKKKTRPAS